MNRCVAFEVSCLFLWSLCFSSCSPSQQSKADARAQDAKADVKDLATKARDTAQQLAQKAKQKSNALGTEMHTAMNGSQTGSEIKTETERLALTARVKSKLANEVGLNTLTGVDVDTSGSVVTLSGVVPTAEDKQRAGTAVGSMPGVQRVINNLQVRRL